MRFKVIALATLAAAVLSAPVFAELQNVEVGGEIRIRGNVYPNGSVGPTFDDDFGGVTDPVTLFLDGEGREYVEQRTRVNVTADFTDDVTAFIEIDTVDEWGNDTRQGNPFGLNAFPPGLTDGVNMYQAYIEMREAWGQPLTIRIGRQEVVLGNEWLVGNNDTAAGFTGLSFDGITARWDFDGGNVQAMYLKVAEFENSGQFLTFEQDGDVDLYGAYLTYDALEAVTLEGYVLYIRDAGPPVGRFGGIGNPANLPGINDHVGEFVTIGARAHGNVSGFNYDVQAAIQNGETADGFAVLGGQRDIDGWAVDATVGYTFENVSNLYLWAGVAYFEGSDTANDSSFLRMFSDVEYSEFLADSDMSNVLILRGGASIQATESIELSAVVSWFEEDEEVGIVLPGDIGADDGIGWELGLYASYDYSEDLNFNVGYAHFFADNDIDDGALIAQSGTALVGGSGDNDDLDYFFFETSISF
jgi:hypothetical protein